MLFKLDNIFLNIPSTIINKVTNGSNGSSLCGRLYLYNRYIGNSFIAFNMMKIIDSIEKDHCLKSARFWRIRHKKTDCFFPRRYQEFLYEGGFNEWCN